MLDRNTLNKIGEQLRTYFPVQPLWDAPWQLLEKLNDLKIKELQDQKKSH